MYSSDVDITMICDDERKKLYFADKTDFDNEESSRLCHPALATALFRERKTLI